MITYTTDIVDEIAAAGSRGDIELTYHAPTEHHPGYCALTIARYSPEHEDNVEHRLRFYISGKPSKLYAIIMETDGVRAGSKYPLWEARDDGFGHAAGNALTLWKLYGTEENIERARRKAGRGK